MTFALIIDPLQSLSYISLRRICTRCNLVAVNYGCWTADWVWLSTGARIFQEGLLA